jgi:large subunit ribosomal protein L19
VYKPRKGNKMNVIDKIEKDQMEKISAERILPEFGAGDTLKVDVKIVEGDKERVQAFEGLCIARSGGGLNENFTVRKISYGEGVERIFPIFSPKIAGITVLKRGKVRRAKLYYLRDRRGKSARIVEKIQVSKKEVKSKVTDKKINEDTVSKS